MGILDGRQFLTGDQGLVKPGDKFRLHNAKIDGTIRVGGVDREQAKLLISLEGSDDMIICFTSGTAIVGQVKQIDGADARAMRNGGLELMLGTKATDKGNPMFLFVDPNGPIEQQDVSPAGSPADF